MQVFDTSSAPPRRVARYDIHGEIAGGGMATVHLGRLHGDRGFTRPVALKRLRPRYASAPSLVAAFLDEAYLSTRVRHANVVSVVDVVSEGDELWLAMEYLDGETLSQASRAARKLGHGIPRPVLVAIVLDVLRGLEAMHAAVDEHGQALSIVHRDVSPQNVLVGTDGVARVLDLGIASSTRSSQHVPLGSPLDDERLKGKLGYMAPEHARGEGPVTRAADLYGVGVILWEGLVGRRLFRGGTDIEAHLADVARGVPSVRELAGAVPHALEAVVLRALDPSPEARFASAREMARALARTAAAAGPEQVAAWLAEVASDNLARRAAWLQSTERPQRRVLEIADESQVDVDIEVTPPPPSAPEPLVMNRESLTESYADDGDPWLAAVLHAQRTRRRNTILGVALGAFLVVLSIVVLHGFA